MEAPQFDAVLDALKHNKSIGVLIVLVDMVVAIVGHEILPRDQAYLLDFISGLLTLSVAGVLAAVRHSRASLMAKLKEMPMDELRIVAGVNELRNPKVLAHWDRLVTDMDELVGDMRNGRFKLSSTEAYTSWLLAELKRLPAGEEVVAVCLDKKLSGWVKRWFWENCEAAKSPKRSIRFRRTFIEVESYSAEVRAEIQDQADTPNIDVRWISNSSTKELAAARDILKRLPHYELGPNKSFGFVIIDDTVLVHYRPPHDDAHPVDESIMKAYVLTREKDVKAYRAAAEEIRKFSVQYPQRTNVVVVANNASIQSPPSPTAHGAA